MHDEAKLTEFGRQYFIQLKNNKKQKQKNQNKSTQTV